MILVDFSLYTYFFITIFSVEELFIYLELSHFLFLLGTLVILCIVLKLEDFGRVVVCSTLYLNLL